MRAGCRLSMTSIQGRPTSRFRVLPGRPMVTVAMDTPTPTVRWQTMRPIVYLVFLGLLGGCTPRGPATRASSAPAAKRAPRASHQATDEDLENKLAGPTKRKGGGRAKGGQLPTDPRFQGVMVREMLPLIGDPRFAAMVRSRTGRDPSNTDAIGEVTGELVARGLRKLTTRELDHLSLAKLHMAQASPSLCSAFWAGGSDEDEVLSVLQRLPEADQVGWLRSIARAALHTLDDPSELAHDPTAMFEGISRIAQSLPPAEQQHFLSSVSAGESASPADGCYAFTSLMQGGRALEQPLRDRFLRELVDPDDG